MYTSFHFSSSHKLVTKSLSNSIVVSHWFMATRTSNMVSLSEDPPYVDERESQCIATAFNGAPNAGSNATFTHS